MNSAFGTDGITPPIDAGLDADHDGVSDADTSTIAWLLPEIVSAFDTATTSLRAFRAGAAGVERQDVDLAPLRVARSHVHQAHGALELGELGGVTLLTEAIEELLGRFERDPSLCDATVLDAIIGGCRAIVEYLEDLQGGAKQQPLYLYASYRDLLTARGADRIHPADLFMVDLSVRPPRNDQGFALDAAGMKEQRSAFEQALLRYMRNDNDGTALAALGRTVGAIDNSVAVTSKQGQQRAFWWSTRALFDALANDGFAATPAQQPHLKRLAGRINMQIRKLVEGSGVVAERLHADVLFFVAIADPVTPLVADVQRRYRLAVPKDFETQRYGRVDASALRKAREALAAAKLSWTAIVSGDVTKIPDFAKETSGLTNAVGPLRRRGLAQVAHVIDGIATDLGFDPRQPPANVGLDVATALLFLESALERARGLDDAFDERAALVVARVEASVLGQENPAAKVEWLDRMSRVAEERLTVATFVAELQGNLRNAEKVLDAFFRDPAERAGLGEAQKSLAQASGALALLGHDDVHRAIDHARTTIEGLQKDDAPVDEAVYGELAQSLGAVGFYVEQIKRDRIDVDAFHFDFASGRFSAEMARVPVAATTLTDTSYGITANAIFADLTSSDEFDRRATSDDDASPFPDDPFAPMSRAFDATEVMEPDGTLEDEIARRAADASHHVSRLRAHPDDLQARDALITAVDDVRRNAMLMDDRPLQDEAASLLKSLHTDGDDALGFASAAELADHVADLATHANRSAGIAAPADVPDQPTMPVPSEENVEAIDAELLEIFLEEAGDVLTEAVASMRVLDADPLSHTATTNLRRGFHTLKGSGRMVGLMTFGAASWSIEETLNDHLAEPKPASADLRSLIDYAIRYLTDWVDELRTKGASSRIPDAMIEAARAVRHATHEVPSTTDADGAEIADVAQAESAMANFADEVVAKESLPTHEDDFLKTVFVPSGSTPSFDRDFAATEVLDTGSEIPDIEFFGDQPRLREDSTESGAEEEKIDFSSLFDPFEAVPVAPPSTVPEEPVAEAIDERSPVEPIHDEAPVASNVVPFALPQTPARNDDLRQIGTLTLSVALFNIYLNEADELLRILTQDFAEWRHELHRFVSEAAMRAAHSLAGSSATVGLVAAHDLAAGIEDILQSLWREPVELNGDQVARLQDAVESLRRMLHRFAAERMPDPDPVRIADLLALRREISGDDAIVTARHDAPVAELPVELVEDPVAAESPLPFQALDFGDEPVVETPAATISPAEEVIDLAPVDEAPVLQDAPVDQDEAFDAITTIGMSETPVAETADAGAWSPDAPMLIDDFTPAVHAAFPEAVDPVAAATPEFSAPTTLPVAVVPVTAVHDDIDPDLLDVFVAEGGEILPQIGSLLRTWQGKPADSAPARMLLRHLHTLKGSARMAGAMRLGEVVHDIEARVESAARLSEVPGTLLEELLSAHDRSLELFDLLQNPQAAPVEQPDAAADGDAIAFDPASDTTADDDHAVVADGATPRMPRARDKQVSTQAVRVNSDTLDRLVNLAGEVSISRARIENEVLQIKGAMSDLSDNVDRLRGQLREIELQAEFQMQSQMQSQQAAGAERDKFDPLEFDRFTRFQELTRMMAESVNDVKTLQQHLQKSLDGAETDLASQRRMTRDLQQDLMRVRMVPFSSIEERLYRVARRTAKEVGKRVNLDIRGGSVEIDRGVLERMAGPFEHMLRNHIVHGIETRDQRRAAGKDETGELLVEVRQEGNEIVVTFSDDGAGLDHDRIRAKGRELGLVDGDIGDARAAELIFHPGFSTASEVTELAGRGVGMDVVRAEALALAGRVAVDSESGKGTRFTINLPVTLAITQVVLVSVASRVYAIPAVLVEQVQQLRPQPLADAYRAGHLAWAGADVRLAFLGTLLGVEDSVPVAQRASPVLILRSSGERIAVHVDEVVGNQEVVVKNLGPQLSRMTGIAGATVLGSGDIVLILNPVQLARLTHADETRGGEAPAGTATAGATPNGEGADLKTLPTVMVVDDSLTVRRVTQRLLSREGYQVVLAKDGVDALEQLQDFPPDVMLVDIEMPRMDGFDLTRNVRNDDRYRHIPIIMITSRTADKHRRHAAELGVDAYLGKPYQEDELLDLLAMHLQTRRTQSA